MIERRLPGCKCTVIRDKQYFIINLETAKHTYLAPIADLHFDEIDDYVNVFALMILENNHGVQGRDQEDYSGKNSIW